MVDRLLTLLDTWMERQVTLLGLSVDTTCLSQIQYAIVMQKRQIAEYGYM